MHERINTANSRKAFKLQRSVSRPVLQAGGRRSGARSLPKHPIGGHGLCCIHTYGDLIGSAVQTTVSNDMIQKGGPLWTRLQSLESGSKFKLQNQWMVNSSYIFQHCDLPGTVLPVPESREVVDVIPPLAEVKGVHQCLGWSLAHNRLAINTRFLSLGINSDNQGCTQRAREHDE